MMTFRNSLSLSLTVSLAGLSLAACQPAMLLDKQAGQAPTAVSQVQAPAVLPAGTFNGMVATYDGSKFVPVAGAEVRLEGTNYVAHTDNDGHYRVDGVKPGSYMVVASKDGMVSGGHEIYMNPVMGTPRVNIAMQKQDRSLLAVPPAATITVSGVVTDPRGSALPGSTASPVTVKVLCNLGNNPGQPANSGFNQTAQADAAGFYAIQIPAVSVSTTQPGQVQVSANGTSPGGVRLETSDVYAYNLTTSTLVANPQCKAFTQPGKPSWPNGSFGAMGSTTQIKANWLSARTDEFYIELWSAPNVNEGAQVGWTYGVLPDSVAITAASGGNPAFGTASFRVPFTMPSNAFTARIVPFGLASKFGAVSGTNNNVSTAFLTSYTQTDFNGDIATSYLTATPLQDGTPGTNTLNDGLFVSGDTANYIIRITNTNTALSQDLRFEGTVPAGTSGLTGTYTLSTGGGAVTIPTGSITQPDGSGRFGVGGFPIPVNGFVTLNLNFAAPINMAKAANFSLTSLGVRMPSANLTLGTAPTNSNALTAANIDTSSITLVGPKDFSDAPGAGTAFVTFTIRPTGATAGGAFRITDRTFTNSTVGTFATIIGTTTQPADGSPCGFVAGDRLEIATDTQTRSISLSPILDLGTVCTFINLSFPELDATRDANNRIQIQQRTQGQNKTIQITANTTANVLTKLGLTSGAPVAGQNGASADFALGTLAAELAYAKTANDTRFTFADTTTNQNPDGSVSTTFTLMPPAAYEAGDTFTSDITVRYRIVQGSGNGLTVGNGSTAPFGAALTAVNTSAVMTDRARDQAVTGKVLADGAAEGNAAW